MSPPTQEIALVTGSNVGIGFEIAKQLLQQPDNRFFVFVASRSLTKGQAAVTKLHEQGLTHCEAIQLDVTDDTSITSAVETVQQTFGVLDVLINNAAIAPDKDLLPTHAPISTMLKLNMATNVAGAAQVTESFTPLLSEAHNPRLVFTSSSIGSLQLVSTIAPNIDWPAYSASKAAENMIMLYFRWAQPRWKVNAYCPGLRSTAINGYMETFGEKGEFKAGPVEFGAKGAVRLATLDEEGETGTFSEYHDESGTFRTVPW